MLKLPLFGAAGGPFILNLLGVPAGAAFSVRKLNGSYTGAALNVRRSSDNATLDIGFLPNGSFNASAFAGFIGASSGFVTKWYDQSGNGRDASQSTAAKQPQLVLNSVGGRAALLYTPASSIELDTASFVSSTSPETMVFVGTRSGAVSTQWAINSVHAGIGFASSANTVQIAATSALQASASDGAWHSIQGIFNGASSLINVDGTETTGTDGGEVVGSSALNVGGANGSGIVAGSLAEVIVFTNVALTAAQRSAVHANQSAYYGTP